MYGIYSEIYPIYHMKAFGSTRPKGSAIFSDCQDAKLLAEAKAINRSLSVGVPKSTLLTIFHQIRSHEGCGIGGLSH